MIYRIVVPGGHDSMTWMGNIPDAAKAMHPVKSAQQPSWVESHREPAQEHFDVKTVDKNLLLNS